jgi:tetratricopeptide (TPR) repeat protein/Zn-dependent protease
MTSSIQYAVAIVVCGGWVLSLCLHEFGHAIVAYWGGDESVKDKGYLTLNPLKYTNLQLSLVIPVLFLLLGNIALPGGAVYINEHQLRGRVWKSAVSAAGPLGSLLTAGLLSVVMGWVETVFGSSHWLLMALAFLIILDLYAVVLNLLPIPGLDGYGILEPWLPTQFKPFLNQVRRYGIWVLFGVLLLVPAVNLWLWTITRQMGEGLGISARAAQEGGELFRSGAPLLIVGGIILVLMARRLTPHQAWYDRGNQQLARGNYEQAVAAFEKAIEQKSDYYDAWTAKGNALVKWQHYAKALDAYDHATLLRPTDSGIWFEKGNALYAMQEYGAAIAAYQKSQEFQPTYGGTWYNIGLCYAQLRDYETAIAAYGKAIELQPDLYDARIAQGDALVAWDRPQAALAVYRDALKLRPGNPDAWMKQAALLEQAQDYETALAAYERLLAYHPDHVTAWTQRGSLLSQLKRYPEAAVAYEQALQLQPAQVDVQIARSTALFNSQQYQAALAILEEITCQHPDHANAWYNQACCHAHLKNTETALQALSQALKLGDSELRAAAKTDPDLDGIRNNQTFDLLVQSTPPSLNDQDSP